MVVAQKSLLAALVPLVAVVVGVRASAVPRDTALTDTTDTSLYNVLSFLNATVGGRLRAAVPFESPCFATVEGKSVSVNTAACSTLQANYSDPTYRVTHFGAYMLPQWETCQSSSTVEGCLLDSSDPTNTAAISGINCQLGNVPPYYIQVKSVSDVQAAIAFSEVTGVRLSVKNKGHDYKGRSAGKNTLSLWMTGLTSLSHSSSFKPTGCKGVTYDAITTGAGVLTQDVYEYAASVNRTIIGGYHETIGFSGGFVLGGGHSVLSPVYGLAVDRVVQFKVVTPDGVYRTANECENTDLFFALRGGGGSAFGVVMESTHRVEPTFPVQVASIKFTPSASTDLAAWYTLMVDSSYEWAQQGWGGHIVGPSIVYVNPLLNNTAAVASMKAVTDFVTARGGSSVVEELPSFLSFFTKYVTAVQAAVGSELELGTRLIPTTFFSTADGRSQLGALINETLPFASPYIGVSTPYAYKGDTSLTSVTPAWRDSIWHLSIKYQYYYNDTATDFTTGYQTLTEHVQKFRDLTPGSGAYFNEGDVYEPDHETSYWGSNYKKLLSIKRKYDPWGTLDCWQCVGWQGEDDDLYQCYVKI